MHSGPVVMKRTLYQCNDTEKDVIVATYSAHQRKAYMELGEQSRRTTKTRQLQQHPKFINKQNPKGAESFPCVIDP